MPQLADCRLPGNSEQKLQKYGLLWCNIVQQFCGSDAFVPPARPLPDSIRPSTTEQFSESFSLLDQQLFAALKAKRLELSNTEQVPAYVVAYDALLRGITHHKPSTLAQAISHSLFPFLTCAYM